MKDLYPFLENVLREINKERRNKQIQLNLQYCEAMKVKSELLKLRANVIKITDETVCPICNYRLGDAYVFQLPNSYEDQCVCSVSQWKHSTLQVLHEGLQGAKPTSTSTTRPGLNIFRLRTINSFSPPDSVMTEYVNDGTCIEDDIIHHWTEPFPRTPDFQQLVLWNKF